MVAIKFSTDYRQIHASWTDSDGENRKFQATVHPLFGQWEADKADIALDNVSQDDKGVFSLTESSHNPEDGSFKLKFVGGEQEKSVVITGTLPLHCGFDPKVLGAQGFFVK